MRTPITLASPAVKLGAFARCPRCRVYRSHRGGHTVRAVNPAESDRNRSLVVVTGGSGDGSINRTAPERLAAALRRAGAGEWISSPRC